MWKAIKEFFGFYEKKAVAEVMKVADTVNVEVAKVEAIVKEDVAR